MLKNKPLYVALILCAAWLSAMPAFAASVGGLSYNIGPSFSIGGGVGFSMRDVHVITDDSISDEARSSRFLIKADIAPVRYVDVYGLIGAGDLQLNDVRPKYQGTLGTTWGVGLRPQLFPLTWRSPLNVTLDAQYLDNQTRDGSMEARTHEIQGSLIFAYVMKSLAPYGGVKYDHMITHFSGVNNDIVGDIDWGAFIGCDYFVTQNVFFNLELSIFAETGFYLSTGYKY
jgi:hypothetical protein